MMDKYRKGWALRYLREAKAELEAAKRIPYIAPNLVLEAIRKARNAIYYSLGEPFFIENVVREAAEKHSVDDPFLNTLIEVEELTQQLSQFEEVEGEKIMKKADSLVQLASDIVETLTGEKIED